MHKSVANLNAITTRLRNGEGSLGQLMNDPALAKSLNATSTNLETMTGKLNRGEGTAGKLLNDDALYKKIDGKTSVLTRFCNSSTRGRAPPACCCATNSYMRT